MEYVRRPIDMKIHTTIILIAYALAVTIALSGCTINRYAQKKREEAEYQTILEEKQMLTKVLNANVGIWTMDDAMIEFGPYPITTYGDSIIICKWSFYKSYWETDNSGGWLAPGWPMLRSVTRNYQLTFDKEKHVMIHYKFWVEHG